MGFDDQLHMAEEIYQANKLGGQQAFPLDSLFNLFNTALTLWTDKNKTKYVDRLISLKKDWLEEYNRSDRSRMTLDEIEDQINILQLAFMTVVKNPEVSS